MEKNCPHCKVSINNHSSQNTMNNSISLRHRAFCCDRISNPFYISVFVNFSIFFFGRMWIFNKFFFIPAYKSYNRTKSRYF